MSTCKSKKFQTFLCVGFVARHNRRLGGGNGIDQKEFINYDSFLRDLQVENGHQPEEARLTQAWRNVASGVNAGAQSCWLISKA